MFFTVLSTGYPQGERRAFLIPDNWDDWFAFRTTFTLIVLDEAGGAHRIGSVKIGHFGLQPGREIGENRRAPVLEPEFEALSDRYFSLGQGEDYYESLNNLSIEMKQRVLEGLRDCAYNLEVFENAVHEPSMQTSLLRSVAVAAVRGRLHRLSRGNAELTDFYFQYTLPQSAPDVPAPTLVFEVTPESQPPSNIHVLIGRNGVGKTRAMRSLTEALLGRSLDENTGGRFVMQSEDANESFAGLVLISFSAFDSFDLTSERTDTIPAELVGLRHRIVVEGVEQGGIKSPTELAADFRKSLERCRRGLRAERWRDAVSTLESDDLFAEANVSSLLDLADDQWAQNAERLFSLLSSGHAIVLLTITRLVELVDERTLVLLDEPEGHLHPPLLSAFIRCLSDLLIKRNGVAVVATHSPVVLQEVPRSCAWKIRRSGPVCHAERPTIETFGENISILTREVFGLEVTRAGFHRFLEAAVASTRMPYEAIIEQFKGQLGAEARAIVQGLIAERDGGRTVQ